MGKKKPNKVSSQGPQMALAITLVVIALVGAAMLLNNTSKPVPGAAPQTFSSDPATLVNQGNAAYDARDYVRAIAYYEQAVALRPNDPNVLVDLGTAYYYKTPSDPNKALYYYDRALQVDPKFPNALFNRGVVKGYGLQDDAGAVQALEEFLKANPTGDQAKKAQDMIREFRR